MARTTYTYFMESTESTASLKLKYCFYRFILGPRVMPYVMPSLESWHHPIGISYIENENSGS